MSRGTRALISRSALTHNLGRVRHFAPQANIWAVIKANAYGHGADIAAEALSTADGFAVSSLDEAIALRDCGVEHPILLLSGVTQADHWAEAAAMGLHCVVHSRTQVEQLRTQSLPSPLSIWLKIDSGMHRLGLMPENVPTALSALTQVTNVSVVGALTHMASADVPARDPATREQFEVFQDACPATLQTSVGNSATILRHADFVGDWVRPGIMLYGATPTTEASAADYGLQPVLTIEAPVIAVRDIAAGESVGYGHRWQAPQPTRIATLAAGYGDGYPRHAPDGTPVWLGGQRVPIAGRVSMDLITVDVSSLTEDVKVGDMAQLWGSELPVDEVADHIGTIGYELLTRLSLRVPKVFV